MISLPLLLNGRTRTTTLMLPPAVAMLPGDDRELDRSQKGVLVVKIDELMFRKASALED